MSNSKDYWKNEAMEWIKSIGLAVIIAIIIKTFIFNTTYVLGYSMYPTLDNKDRLFTNKIIYRFDEPEKGDIVVIEAPDDPEKDYIKRVIAVEGDNVKIENGNVYVNNEKLDEKYIENNLYTYNELEIKVPKNEIFVLGDNRRENASKDSRVFGTVSIDSVKGKAFFRYYPFGDNFGFLD